jgi:hypothetical protein
MWFLLLSNLHFGQYYICVWDKWIMAMKREVTEHSKSHTEAAKKDGNSQQSPPPGDVAESQMPQGGRAIGFGEAQVKKMSRELTQGSSDIYAKITYGSHGAISAIQQQGTFERELAWFVCFALRCPSQCLIVINNTAYRNCEPHVECVLVFRNAVFFSQLCNWRSSELAQKEKQSVHMWNSDFFASRKILFRRFFGTSTYARQVSRPYP